MHLQKDWCVQDGWRQKEILFIQKVMRRSQGVATDVGDYGSQKTTPCDLKLSPFAGQKKYEAKVHISNTNMEKEKNTAGGNSGDQDA